MDTQTTTRLETGVILPANGPLVQTPAPTATPRLATANLAQALAQAQQKCRAVDKGAENKHHQYRYASAEQIIVEAKDALADTGLSIVPVEGTLNHTGGSYELACKFLLLHTSGESLPMVRHWPVIPGNGRPLDKATGAAATLALSYLLRDLLLMPRVDNADDVNNRNDSEAPARKGRDKPAQAPAPAGPNDALIRQIHRKVVALARAKQLTGVWGLALVGAGFKAGDDWAEPRTGDQAAALLGNTPEANLRKIEQWLDQQLAAPAAADTSLGDLAARIHPRLAAADKTWLAALRWVGAEPPRGWPEPASAQAAATSVPQIATREQLEKILESLERRAERGKKKTA